MPRPPGLRIEGARQNNLKNISLEIPHDRLTVVTGVSGSGKSSLAFDTLFAEGQWRYIESLSTYARMFLDRVDRPDVDRIENVRPAVALEQKNPVRTARSTVGTATEVYDYLRLLYAKIGRVHCPACGAAAVSHSPDSIADALLSEHAGARALVTFPLPVPAGQPVDRAVGRTHPARLRPRAGGRRAVRPRRAAAGAGRGHDRGGARSRRARRRAAQSPGGIAGERAARGRRPGRGRAGRRRAARLRRGVPLQRVRHRARAAAAAALLLQSSARRLQRVQGLRQHPQVRRGAGGARPHAEPQRRRGRAVDASLRQVVPARAAEGGQARRPRSDEAVGRARRAGARLRVRGRGQVSRHQRLLRGDRVLPLQAARAGLPLALPQPVALPGLPGRAAQAAGARRARGRADHRRVRDADHRSRRRARGRSRSSPRGKRPSPARSCASCRPSSRSCCASASATSRWRARRARCRAARPSASTSPTSSAPSWSARSTCSTSRRSGCTRATRCSWSISAASWPRPATRSSSSSTTAASSRRPITWSSWVRARASAAARSSWPARRRSSAAPATR